MIEYQEALEKFKRLNYAVQQEVIPLTDCFEHILAEDIFADTNIPPFDKSAMDGYACKKSDLKSPLKVLETIAAGDEPTADVIAGTCSRIMTGAKVPQGADCVVMIEDTTEENGVMRFTAKNTKDNILYTAEDITKGERVLEKGTFLKAQHLAILATFGIDKVPVYQKVNVAVFVTGSEIVEPGNEAKAAQIRNSNAYQLLGQLQHFPVEVDYFGIVKDNPEELKVMFQQVMKTHQVSICTGGASKGDFDFVPKVLTELGFELLFDKIAIQPGKPVSVSHTNKHIALGLSGNPVSSFIQFELLFKPLLEIIFSMRFQKNIIRLPFAGSYNRKKNNRLKLIPVAINDAGEAEEVEFHGSAHLLALKSAQGLVSVPMGVNTIEKGALVDVRLI